MSPSISYAISQAMHRTKRILFQPFDIGKWFILGFGAWLAYLGESGGGGGGFNYSDSRDWSNLEQAFKEVWGWIDAHFLLFVLLGCISMAVIVILWVLFTWLRARGQLMFLDGVARNQAAVVEPWHRFRLLGRSLFWFNLIMGLVAACGSLLILGLGLLVAWPDILARDFGGRAVAAIVMYIVLIVPWAIFFAIISQLVRDFIVPVMYLRHVNTIDAWGIFRREIVPGQFWNFVLFYLMKIVLGLAVMIVAFLFFCVTCGVACCLAIVPYIGTVLLLPLIVFMRCYSLFFLSQFGPPWHVFTDEPVMVPPVAYPPPDYPPFPPAPTSTSA